MRSEFPRFRQRDVREVALYQHGLVTLADLQALTVSSADDGAEFVARSMLEEGQRLAATTTEWCARGRLLRLAPRVYLLPELLDDRSHLAAACLARPGALASHRAAANLWNLDGIDVDLVEITVTRPTRSGSALVHRSADLAEFEVVEREAFPCTDPARTLIDLGAVVVDDILERALEDGLRRGLTSVSRLRWRGRQLARPGRAGPAALRRVLERRPQGAPRTESDLETQFLQCLRAAGVREPVRQHRLRLTDGTMVRLDDAYPEELLFVELDGWASHGGRTAFRQDRRRQNQVVLLGWRPLRFTWTDVVEKPERVAAEVAQALAEVPQVAPELRSDGRSLGLVRASVTLTSCRGSGTVPPINRSPTLTPAGRRRCSTGSSWRATRWSSTPGVAVAR
jgi:very-short-patch-repair endonuclease